MKFGGEYKANSFLLQGDGAEETSSEASDSSPSGLDSSEATKNQGDAENKNEAERKSKAIKQE